MSPTRRKIKANPLEDPKESELVDITDSKENWNEYLLADGTVLRMRGVLTEVWRVLDEFDADGNPRYILKSSNITSVNAPDALRKR